MFTFPYFMTDLMKSIDDKSMFKLKSAVKKTRYAGFQDRIPEEFRVASTLYGRYCKYNFEQFLNSLI